MKVPIVFPVAEILNELSSAGNDGDDPGLGHGVFDGAQVVEGMAEGEDLVPVHVRDRPDGREVEVAGDELEGHGIAVAGGIPYPATAGLTSDWTLPPALWGRKPSRVKNGPAFSMTRRRKPAEDERHGERIQARPGRRGRLARRGTTSRDMARSSSSESEGLNGMAAAETDAVAGLGRLPWRCSSISPMGVIPAIASLAKVKAEGHGPDELAVDVDRAAAHAGDDARRFEVPAAEPGDDDVPLGD